MAITLNGTSNIITGVIDTANTAGTANTVIDATQSNITTLGNLTIANIDNIQISNNTISSTDVNGNINLTPNGTGAVVSSTTLFDSIGNVRDLPLNNQTTLYTLTSTDDGKLVTSNVNVTVPNGTFSGGQVITLYNNSAASWTLIQGGAVTMYLAGTASTGNRTLSQRGLATVICTAANTFVVSGSGLS